MSTVEAAVPSTSGPRVPERVRLSVGDERRRDDARRRRLVDAGRAGAARCPRRGGRRRLRLPPRRRPTPRPDPRSRRQPDGVHALSRLRRRRRSPGPTTPGPVGSSPGRSIYELHVGTFTPEGTLDAAIDRLDHLARPRRRPRRADAGQRLQRHPQLGLRRRRAGSPCTRRTAARTAYQRFVDACHAAGLGVIQDVVYNHLGPSGNYLPLFGPYLKRRAATPGATWSTSTARAPTEVRRYILDNVRMWLERLPRRRAAARRRARAHRRLRRCTCSRRWRSRSPRSRPTCAGR